MRTSAWNAQRIYAHLGCKGLILPHPSTDRNETRSRNLPIKFGTNPSTIFLVIVVTDIQTDTQTNAGKTYSLAFTGRKIHDKREDKPMHCWVAWSRVYPVPQLMTRRQENEPIVFSHVCPSVHVSWFSAHSFISSRQVTHTRAHTLCLMRV